MPTSTFNTANLHVSVGRNPENLEETHTDTERTQKHRKSLKIMFELDPRVER